MYCHSHLFAFSHNPHPNPSVNLWLLSSEYTENLITSYPSISITLDQTAITHFLEYCNNFPTALFPLFHCVFCFPPGIQVLPTCATHNPAEFHISFRIRPKDSVTFHLYKICPGSLTELSSFISPLTAWTSVLPSVFSSTNTLSVPSPHELCTCYFRNVFLSNKSRTLFPHFIQGSTHRSYYQEFFLDLLFKMAVSVLFMPLTYLSSLHIIYLLLIYLLIFCVLTRT